MRKSKANRAFVTSLSLNYRNFKAFKSDFRQKCQEKDMQNMSFFKFQAVKCGLFCLVLTDQTHLKFPDIFCVFAC